MGTEALKAKMQSLGMRPVTRTDGSLVGVLPFRNLVNAFTQSAILAATMRNEGDDAIVCIAPAHLAHLPAIRILDIPDAVTLEHHVHQFYQRRLERLRDANQFSSMLGLTAALDEPGFRVTVETWVGDDVVKFTVRPGQVVQVISISGRNLEMGVDAKERRVDARKVTNVEELATVLEPLVARLKAPRRPAAPKFDPMSVVSLVPASPKKPAPPPDAAGATPTEGATPDSALRPSSSFRELDEADFAQPSEGAPLPPSTSSSPAPGSKREGADMFDRDFSGFQDREDTFGGPTDVPAGSKTRPAGEATGTTPDARFLALVCGECGRFYLGEEHPKDVRTLDTCPGCLGR